jgi:hypothetical protein
MPIILDSGEADIRSIEIPGQFRQKKKKNCVTLFQQKKAGYSGMAVIPSMGKGLK